MRSNSKMLQNIAPVCKREDKSLCCFNSVYATERLCSSETANIRLKSSQQSHSHAVKKRAFLFQMNVSYFG